MLLICMDQTPPLNRLQLREVKSLERDREYTRKTANDACVSRSSKLDTFLYFMNLNVKLKTSQQYTRFNKL